MGVKPYRTKFKPNAIAADGSPAVSISYYEQMDDWCLRNCKGDWENSSEWLIYRFQLRNDAIMFKLAWG